MALNEAYQVIVDEAMSAEGGQIAIKLKRLIDDKWNALMLAAKYDAKYVPTLIARIKVLESQDKRIVLNQLINRWNVLMLAARYNPQAVPAILDVIADLPSEAQAQILRQTTDCGWNTAMLAVRYGNIACVSSILKAISNLGLEEQKNIITNFNRDSWNVLMLAARHGNRDVVSAILNMVSNLSLEDQKKILKQLNQNNFSHLSLALRYNANAVVSLILAHCEINDFSIFEKHTSLLVTITMNKASDLLPLLKIVGDLPYKTQRCLYRHLTPTQFASRYVNEANLDGELRHQLRCAISHAEVRYHLAELKEKADKLDCKIGFNKNLRYKAPAEEALKLYNRLKESYEAYMSGGEVAALSTVGQKSATKDVRLLAAWGDAIEDAKPVLSKHRGIKEIVFRLCALLFTPFICAKDYLKGHSFEEEHYDDYASTVKLIESPSYQFKFFPNSPNTDSMNKVNKVMNALERESDFGYLMPESESGQVLSK